MGGGREGGRDSASTFRGRGRDFPPKSFRGFPSESFDSEGRRGRGEGVSVEGWRGRVRSGHASRIDSGRSGHAAGRGRRREAGVRRPAIRPNVNWEEAGTVREWKGQKGR